MECLRRCRRRAPGNCQGCGAKPGRHRAGFGHAANEWITGGTRDLTNPPGDFPYQLLTGRGSAAQWHTQTRTAKSGILRKLYPQDPYVEIHPADVAELDLRAGQWASVESRRGRARARVLPTPTIPQGCLFLPMHDESTNRLTDAVFDPVSRQPAYKSCAARVRAIEAEEPVPGAQVGLLNPQTTAMGSPLQ